MTGGGPELAARRRATTVGNFRSLEATRSFDTVADADAVPAFVEARLAQGAEYLKIVIDDGATAGLRLPALAPDVVAALLEAAHTAGLRTIRHTVTARDAAIALDAGIDGLAHVRSAAGASVEADSLRHTTCSW